MSDSKPPLLKNFWHWLKSKSTSSHSAVVIALLAVIVGTWGGALNSVIPNSTPVCWLLFLDCPPILVANTSLIIFYILLVTFAVMLFTREYSIQEINEQQEAKAKEDAETKELRMLSAINQMPTPKIVKIALETYQEMHLRKLSRNNPPTNIDIRYELNALLHIVKCFNHVYKNERYSANIMMYRSLNSYDPKSLIFIQAQISNIFYPPDLKQFEGILLTESELSTSTEVGDGEKKDSKLKTVTIPIPNHIPHPEEYSNTSPNRGTLLPGAASAFFKKATWVIKDCLNITPPMIADEKANKCYRNLCRQFYTKETIRSVISIPLKNIKGEVIAILNLYASVQNVFNLENTHSFMLEIIEPIIQEITAMVMARKG